MRRIVVPLMAAFLVAPAAQSDTVTIDVANTAFGANNAAVTIQPGDTVKWVWVSGTHTVTSGPNGTADGKFNASINLTSTSFTLSPDMANYPFNQVGIYPYFCSFHFACCGMASSIVVANSTGASPSRTLGATMKAPVAAARNGASTSLAAVAGTKLFLMNAMDAALADVANWTGGRDVGATVSGRPAFGNVGGKMAVAIGTDAGRAVIFDTDSGTAVSDVTLPGASIAGAPAIVSHSGGDDTYWAAETASGPALFMTRGTTIAGPISLGAASTTLRSSPAVFGGTLVVGTGADVRTFRIDPSTGVLTPQATSATGDDFNTSPVVTRVGEALAGAASGSVHKVNLSTGSEDGAPASLPGSAAPLSDPFYDAGNDLAAFGGADGKVYFIKAGAIGTAPAEASSSSFGSSALDSPVIIGATTYVADASGAFGAVGAGSPAQMGSAAGPAVAASGTAAGTDKVFASTVDGKLFAIPVQ